MKGTVALLLALSVVCNIYLYGGREDLALEAARLRTKVSALEQRIAELEAQLDAEGNVDWLGRWTRGILQ